MKYRKQDIALVFLFVFVLFSGFCLAQTIILKSGEEIQGDIIEEADEHVHVVVSYPRQDIEQIRDETGAILFESNQDKRFVQSDGLFALTIPQDWQWQESLSREIEISNPQASNSISIQFKPQEGTAQEIVQETTKAIKLMFEWHKANIATESQGLIDGVYAHHLEYILSEKGVVKYGARYIFSNDGYSFIISYLARSLEEKQLMNEIVKNIDFPPFRSAPDFVKTRFEHVLPAGDVVVDEVITSSIQGTPSLSVSRLREQIYNLNDRYAMAKIIGAGILFVLCMLVWLIGGIMLLVASFKTSIVWGLACLFLPFVQLIFIMVHWPRAKRAFSILVLSFLMMIAAGLLVFPIVKKLAKNNKASFLALSQSECIKKHVGGNAMFNVKIETSSTQSREDR